MSQRIKRRLITGSLFRAANGLVGVLLAGLLLWSEPTTAANARSLWQFIQTDTGLSVAAQSEQEARLLEPGKPIELELAGGQIHSYQLTLAAGQFLHVVVEQRGIDVVVILFGPDGGKLAEVDSPNGEQGPEPVKMVAEATGSYRLEVRALEKDAAAGRYEVKITELRAATPLDKNLLAAERALAEGGRLSAQGTAESRRKALEKYEEALSLWRAAGDRKGEAGALNRIGGVYRGMRERQRSLDYYRQALSLFQSLGDRQGEASTFYGLGFVYSDMGEKQKALDHFDQALSLYREIGARGSEASTLNTLGSTYSSLGENQKALEYYGQALALFKASGDRQWEANTLNTIGNVYRSLGENQKAIDHFRQALTLFRTLGDRWWEAYSLYAIGNTHSSLGEKREALNYLDQALTLFQTLSNRHWQATTLQSIAGVYGDLGEHQQALDRLNQALKLSRASGDRSSEASVLSTIGSFYSSLNQHLALNYYQQALTLLKELGDRRSEASVLHSIGRAYFSSGEPQKSLDYYSQALQLLRNFGDRRDQANLLDHIGFAHRDLDNKQQALDYLSQALQHYRDNGDRSGQAHILHSIGDIYLSMGEYQRALDYGNQSLSTSRAIGSRHEEVSAHLIIGRAYASSGEHQKAIISLNQALQLWRGFGERYGEVLTLYHLARAERDRGKLHEARSQIEAALKINESLRAKVSGHELRASYFASMRKHYEFYIDLLMRLHRLYPAEGHDAMALQASERARARSLIELLTEARADIRQGVDRELLERERALQQQLNTKEQRRIQTLSGKHTPEQIAAIEKELDGLLTQYQEVQAQIRATSPRYAALTQPQPLALSEIQRQALDDDTLLLEYALGEERSYLWLVSPHSITSFELPARSVVEDAARRVYDLLTARARKIPDETATQRQARIAQSDKDFPAAAAALSRIVLGPVAAQLGKKRLVVVSDGALQYIPFAALPKPVGSTAASGKRAVSGPPLMLEHEIVSLPSASTLAVMRRELAGRHPAPKIAAVLADPVFEPTDPRIKTVAGAEQKPAGDQSNRQDTALKGTFIPRALDEAGVVNPGQPIPRLPYSQREAATIRSLVPNGLRRLALDFEASYATATSPELSDYRIVHFATHGLLNSKQPELSGILLSLVDEQGRPQENGLLRLGEIFNLKLPAELVVLSACQTALGKEVKGEGLVGMTRGFMYAGAARVVASLWKVDDRATAELMKLFYEGMLGKRRLRPAEALRQAQIAMWRQSEWRSPIYWGAFTFQGEWK